MALDGKTIKEEISDKEPYEATNLRQKNKAKDSCDTPGSPETSRVIAPRSPISPQLHPTNLVTPSPQLKSSNNNKNGSSSPINFRNAETPPPTIGGAPITNSAIHAQDQTRALIKTKRFFGALIQFGQESCQDNGDKVRALILSLASGSLTADEFKLALQEATNFPVRQNVLPFLRSHIPILQREISNLSRKCNQTPLQYVRANEHCVIELNNNVHETSEIFMPLDNGTPSNNNSSVIPSLQTSQIFCKRRASDNFLENHNGGNDWNDLIPAKRPYHPMISSSSHPSYPSHSQYLEYQNSSHLHSDSGSGGVYSSTEKTNNIPRDERDMRMLSQSADAYRRDRERQSANEDEWKNIHTMLSCISAMVEKTKRAITILQQRSSDGPISSQEATIAEIKRQTEERVAEFKRNAEEAVNQVKRQAVIEIQRAVAAAENRTIDIIAQERLKMDKFFTEISKSSSESVGDGHSSQSPLIPGLQNTCWNCGRTANETCSGCNSARYCNALCQHKDWDQHLKVCGISRAELGMPKTLQINVKPPIRLSPITSQQPTPPQPPPQKPPSQSQPPVTNGVIACSIK